MTRFFPLMVAVVAMLFSSAGSGQFAQNKQNLQSSGQNLQGQNPGGGDIIRTVLREVKVLNPLTGQIETRMVEEKVVVRAGGNGGQAGAFSATFVNNGQDVLTVR